MTRPSRLLLTGALSVVLTLGATAGLGTTDAATGAAPTGAAADSPTAACAAARQQATAAVARVARADKRLTRARRAFVAARRTARSRATAVDVAAVVSAANDKAQAKRQRRKAQVASAGAQAAASAACAPGVTPGAPTVPATPGTPVVPAPPAGPGRPDDPIAHDPTVVKEGKWYYLAITGDAATGRDYLPMKRSQDLLHWEPLPPVFTQLPAEVVAAIPDEAPPAGVGADAPKDAWAPDLSWTGSEWRLYYSASRFGTTNSVTALATNATLDPDSPDYRWVDQGIVLETEPGAAYNAIDANYVQDAEGGAWLTFGSFFGGLQIVALDPATGKLATGATPRTIVHRPIQFNPVEGPSVIRNGGYYYLFAAFDYCCRGVESDYRVVVGRSTSITGPYVDQAGRSMLDGGGTEVLRGYNEFQGTGHPDVFSSDGVDHLVNHYYDLTSGGTPRLNVRTLVWTDGWPVVSDPVNPSRWAGHGSSYVQVLPRDGAAAVGTVGCGYAGADVALTTSDPDDACQQWQIDARDASQVTDGSETGSRFQNRNSNMAADFPGCAEAETSGDVRQFDWLGNFFYNVCQRWTFSAAPDGWTTVTSIAGRRLVWAAAAPTAGSDLGLSTPTGATTQQFRFQPVGEVLLGGVDDRTQALGVTGCRAGRGNGDQVRLETRSGRSCQTWTITSAGGARYTVTNVDSGRRLASTGCLDATTTDDLELVAPGGAATTCSTWTLVPGNDGTWSLTASGTTRDLRLLNP